MRLIHDRRANFPIQFRQSILIVVICYDVEVHENTKAEYIRQHVSLENHLLFYKICQLLTNITIYFFYIFLRSYFL